MRIFYRFFLVIYLLVQCIWIGSVGSEFHRFGHGAVLINNKLYVYGGRLIIPPKTSESVGLNDDSNELLMLDMTSSFDSASSPWQNITPTNAPNISFHAMSTGGSKVVIWGGETPGEQPSNSLLYFDTITLQMNIQNSSSNPPGTIESSMVTRINDSVAYIYGGYTGSSAEVLGGSTPRSPSFSKNMYALNIDSGSFSLQSNTNNAPPQGLIQHSATILSNGKIYIIGGLIPGANGALSSMSKIYIFDTLQNTWSQLNATNPSPPNRRLHGAIGTPDNKIIIFGGADLNFLKYNDIAVLDTFNEILSWSLQNTTGTPPSARYAHTFTLVGNNAIVAFGNADDISSSNTTVFILDITDYTWKTQYIPQALPKNTPTVGTPPNPTNKSTKNTAAIVGATISAVALVLITGAIMFCLIRRKRKSSFLSTPYDKNTAAAPPIMGPAPVNDNLPPTIPPFDNFQKDLSIGSDTRVLNSAEHRHSSDSSRSNLSNNPSFNSQLNTVYKDGEYLPQSENYSDERVIMSLPTQYEDDNNSQQLLNSQTYPQENYQQSTNTSYPPGNYQSIPLSINTDLDQFYNIQEQSYKPPSHYSSQDNLSQIYRPDEGPIQTTSEVTQEGDSNEMSGFKSPLFRTETLSPLAGMAATIPSDSRPLSLRSATRMNIPPSSRTNTSIQPSKLRSETPESLGHSRMTSIDSNDETRNLRSDNDGPKGRLFVLNRDPDGYESD